MKKGIIISIILCLVLLLSLSANSFAWTPGSRDSKINMGAKITRVSGNNYTLEFNLDNYAPGYGGTIYVEIAGHRGSTDKSYSFTPRQGKNTVTINYPYNAGHLRFTIYHATQYDQVFSLQIPEVQYNKVHEVTRGDVTAQKVGPVVAIALMNPILSLTINTTILYAIEIAGGIFTIGDLFTVYLDSPPSLSEGQIWVTDITSSSLSTAKFTFRTRVWANRNSYEASNRDNLILKSWSKTVTIPMWN